ncbi:MAG: UDP-N-acetylmuramoyl-tripeptide--D-alanyl-D-alanine ligase [Gemmatimonadetes bacterium]|nr:UDP-N-acetylmuramoyl-tripeptide--D-alanyl-D-alanine ligase [Gemmatimonadota bacterium]
MSARFAALDVTAALGVDPTSLPDPGAVFERVTLDSRRTAADDLFVAIRGERHDGNAFLAAAVREGATGAVGEDRRFEARGEIAFWPVEDGRGALQRLAHYHRRRLSTTVVGVTGSNGKTTTKELIAAVLAQAFRTVRTEGNLNNQIGVPLTLLSIDVHDRWAVVEMGMNRPGEIAPLAAISEPSIGVLTNVAASHLEGVGSIEAVLEEKLALARALGPGDLLVYCGDQAILREAVKTLRCRTLSYGLEAENDLVPDSWSLDEEGRGAFVLEGRTYRLRLAGRHNVVNALAAVAVGREAGLSPGRIAVGLAEPDTLPMRMQLERWGEVVALVDCYNANPESVLSAAATLTSLGGARRRIAVLGEMLELGERSEALHQEVGRGLSGSVDLVVIVGEGAAPIADGAESAGLESRLFADRGGAIAWLSDHVEPGDALLFKASRGAALETVVGAVRAACLDAAANGAAARGSTSGRGR